MDTVSDRPRFLVLGRPGGRDQLPGGGTDLVPVHSWAEALEAIRRESYDGILADFTDPSLLETFRTFDQAERILAIVPDGVAVVDFDLRIHWTNPTFRSWCVIDPVGHGFYEALGSPEVPDADFCPFHTALARLSMLDQPTQGPGSSDSLPLPPVSSPTRLHCRDNRYLDLLITPLRESRAAGLTTGQPPGHELFIVLGREVTALVRQQQKLDALHKAGRELTALPPEQLAEMSVAERVELLKVNIRRLTRDLLHYEVIEIRLLDPATGRLELLLQDGMTPEAAHRVLYAKVEGNGVTGYVAATGKSHLCPDTASDPLYLPGAAGAHSSLTVPLLFNDAVVGTFNVENPQLNAFGETDRQFAEIFSHAVASALNTLELLSLEMSSATSRSIEAVMREVALPVDEILADACTLDSYVGINEEMAARLRAILDNARRIKQSIQKVGEQTPEAESTAGMPFAHTHREVPQQPLKGKRVLVADSDDRVRRSAHGLLGRWGAIVETARDGREAVTMARLARYDAILADIRLPDLDAYEVYRQVRAAQPQASVILMTGYGYDPRHTIVRARQEGLKHVLFKPFRVDQLREALTGQPC
jgi:two-component system, sensor histidine kinase SagS